MSMHFPSDIFFGAYLGAIVPVLLYKNYFEKKLNFMNSQALQMYMILSKLMYWRILYEIDC